MKSMFRRNPSLLILKCPCFWVPREIWPQCPINLQNIEWLIWCNCQLFCLRNRAHKSIIYQKMCIQYGFKKAINGPLKVKTDIKSQYLEADMNCLAKKKKTKKNSWTPFNRCFKFLHLLYIPCTTHSIVMITRPLMLL